MDIFTSLMWFKLTGNKAKKVFMLLRRVYDEFMSNYLWVYAIFMDLNRYLLDLVLWLAKRFLRRLFKRLEHDVKTIYGIAAFGQLLYGPRCGFEDESSNYNFALVNIFNHKHNIHKSTIQSSEVSKTKSTTLG